MMIIWINYQIRELESVLGKAINGGRVVWTGSQTSEIAMFSWADLQGIGRYSSTYSNIKCINN
jgi:hypothetical protein